MSDDLDIEAMADIVGGSLGDDPTYRVLTNAMKFASLDCGEIYIRAPGGAFFRLLVEAVSPDDIEGWGIEFDD